MVCFSFIFNYKYQGIFLGVDASFTVQIAHDEHLVLVVICVQYSTILILLQEATLHWLHIQGLWNFHLMQQRNLQGKGLSVKS